MKQENEKNVHNVQLEQYEAPQIEGPILQMSGEDSGRQIW